MIVEIGGYQYVVDVNIGICWQMFKLEIVCVVVIGGNDVNVVMQNLDWQCMSGIVDQQYLVGYFCYGYDLFYDVFIVDNWLVFIDVVYVVFVNNYLIVVRVVDC